jgi:hypothetical protein
MRLQKGIQVLGIGVLFAAVAACASVNPGARRDAAWSERLTRQAAAQQVAAERQERAFAAWSQRLTGMARAYQAEQARAERADAAYSLRLTKLADYILSGSGTD